MNLGGHVSTGQPIRLPADLMNVLRQMAQEYMASNASGAGAGASAGSSGTVLVSNDSGADVPEFSVLGIDGTLASPDEHLDVWKRSLCFSGVTPTLPDYAGWFVVTLAGIKSGDIGAACISGLVRVQVNINDENDWWADVKDGDATQLDSGATGTAQIVGARNGTGTQWCMVRLGVTGPSNLRAKVVSFTEGDGYSVKVIDMDGNEYQQINQVPNHREDSEVNNLFDVDEPVTIFSDGAGKWYIDSGREVLR